VCLIRCGWKPPIAARSARILSDLCRAS
jgi:hypothetical protein